MLMLLLYYKTTFMDGKDTDTILRHVKAEEIGEILKVELS